jgi:hypothetical protein
MKIFYQVFLVVKSEKIEVGFGITFLKLRNVRKLQENFEDYVKMKFAIRHVISERTPKQPTQYTIRSTKKSSTKSPLDSRLSKNN